MTAPKYANRSRLRTMADCLRLVVFLLAIPAFSQSLAEIESPKVNSVAERMACNCGCNLNMACKMEPWPCHVCRAAKQKIFAMQAAGKSESQILDSFVAENGKQVLNSGPGFAGLAGPVTAIIVGLTAIVWFVRRQLLTPVHSLSAAGADPEVLDRIEREMAQLD